MPRDFTPHQRGIVKRYYDNRDTILLQRLGELVSEIAITEDTKKADALWKRAHKALLTAGLEPGRADMILEMRSVEGLATILAELQKAAPAATTAPAEAAQPAPQPLQPRETPATASPGDQPTDDDLKAALKAFRKRLKLERLDEQSKLGHGPLSSGGGSVVAIEPPRQFPRPVWEKLVEQGKLKRAGRGLYELVE